MSGGFAPDYIQVNERLIAFREKYPEGCVQAEIIEFNETRVTMRALAYRTPDDPRPGIGHSSLGIPGATSYTRGSELENCETSAWGRALAALGFEVKRAIASAEEVAKAAPAAPQRPQPPVPAPSGPPTHAPAAVAAQRELPDEPQELPDEPQEFDFRTKQQISPPEKQYPQTPDEPPFPGSPGPARSPRGGHSEGGVHTDGHNRLRARQSGALYCPTKMPDGSWCPWRP